jgi:hypothetical protein
LVARGFCGGWDAGLAGAGSFPPGDARGGGGLGKEDFCGEACVFGKYNFGFSGGGGRKLLAPAGLDWLRLPGCRLCRCHVGPEDL